MAKPKRILIIAAHPDDEVLGCGGAIVEHAHKGDYVYVCIVTRAWMPKWDMKYIDKKEAQQLDVDNILSIQDRLPLGFETIKLNTIPHHELADAIAEVVDKIKPDMVYTHFYGDLNEDHKIVAKASLVACRPPKKIKILMYEVPSTTELGLLTFSPNYYIRFGKNTLQQKINAYKMYSQEIKQTRSITKIKALAMKRGTDICVNYAEAFKLVREVV